MTLALTIAYFLAFIDIRLSFCMYSHKWNRCCWCIQWHNHHLWPGKILCVSSLPKAFVSFR